MIRGWHCPLWYSGSGSQPTPTVPCYWPGLPVPVARPCIDPPFVSTFHVLALRVSFTSTKIRVGIRHLRQALGTCAGRNAASKCARLSARYRKVSYIYCCMPLFMQPGSVPTAGLQKLSTGHNKRRATGRGYAKGVPLGFTCGRIFPHTACHGMRLCQIIV